MLTSPGPTRAGTLALLELGTNSLKLHFYSPALERLEPHRVEWEVGFEVYSSGVLCGETIDHIVDQVRGLLDRCGIACREDLFGIATGVFREAENTSLLLDRLDREFSIPVRLLTGAEEALLLLQGFRDRIDRRPTMVFDLGGGRLEMVFMGAGQSYLHETLPLGVIRIYHHASYFTGQWNEAAAVRWIRENLRKAKSVSLDEIHGTGGTVKTIAQVAGASRLTRDILCRVEEDARRSGPPASLPPRRQATFLPGALVLEHLLEHVGAEALFHHPVGLGEVLMDLLRPFYRVLGGKLRRAFLENDLDVFT